MPFVPGGNGGGERKQKTAACGDPDTSSDLLQQEPSSSSSSTYRKVAPIKHDRPFKEEHDRRNFCFCPWVSKSSNDLFCTLMLEGTLDYDFFIYNPSTR
ncbi:hypothetical protein EZV62_011907 [Acer yangbiense]|uniref:Uncharacterized protein n=1 Tax=Acer yangbiense TaxID=1000413 RepID=A0A5C7I5W3_9ROSI|nr:hypothetical protein EZV62_011907 [Acer yangbiense]